LRIEDRIDWRRASSPTTRHTRMTNGESDLGAEPARDRDQAVERKPIEVSLTDPRKIRGGNSGHGLRLSNGKAAQVEHPDDGASDNGLELKQVRVRITEITV
jgi:hypothetical protein